MKFKHKIGRFLIFFRFSNFDFSIFNFKVTFLQFITRSYKVHMHLDFFGMIFLFCEHCLSQILSMWHFNQTWSFFVAEKKIFSWSRKKTLDVSIYFVKSFLNYQSFQETRASSTVSSETNRAVKIILNMSGVGMQVKLKSRMVLSTREKSLWAAILRYSWSLRLPEIAKELFKTQ